MKAKFGDVLRYGVYQRTPSLETPWLVMVISDGPQMNLMSLTEPIKPSPAMYDRGLVFHWSMGFLDYSWRQVLINDDL